VERNFVEKVGFEPEVKEWRSDGWWEWGWWETGWQVDEEVNRDKTGEADGIIHATPSFDLLPCTHQSHRLESNLIYGSGTLHTIELDWLPTRVIILWSWNIGARLP